MSHIRNEDFVHVVNLDRNMKSEKSYGVLLHQDITLTPYNNALAIILVKAEPNAVVAVVDDLPVDHVEPFDEDVVHNV